MDWAKFQASFRHDLETDSRTCAPFFGEKRFDGLGVYTNGYSIRTKEYLEDDFPETLKRIPVEILPGLIKEFAKREIGALTAADFGKTFPQFLGNMDLPIDLAYLPDLARLEWAMVEAFYSPELPDLNREKIQSLSETDLQRATFLFDPAMQIVKTSWGIWELLDGQKAEQIDVHYLVYRDQGEPTFRELGSWERAILEHLSLGNSLGTLDKTNLHSEDFAEWVSSGLLRDIQVIGQAPKP